MKVKYKYDYNLKTLWHEILTADGQAGDCVPLKFITKENCSQVRLEVLLLFSIVNKILGSFSYSTQVRKLDSEK